MVQKLCAWQIQFLHAHYSFLIFPSCNFLLVPFDYYNLREKEEFEREIKIRINAGQFKLNDTKSFDAALVGIKNRFKI